MSTLAERIEALAVKLTGGWSIEPEQLTAILSDVRELESGLRDLLEDTQHDRHHCDDTEENCPVLRARAILSRTSEKEST